MPSGVARYPGRRLPVMDPETGKTLVDELGRAPTPPRSPTVRPSARTSRLPICLKSTAKSAASWQVEYFSESYPVEVAGVGYAPLYDPENAKPRS
jgi:hypothetical protein